MSAVAWIGAESRLLMRDRYMCAAQVGRILSEHPDPQLAVAYGVPCSVSDELMMSAIKLREGARFRPRGLLRVVRRTGQRRQHGPQVVPPKSS